MKKFTPYLLVAALAVPFLFTTGSCTRTTGANPTDSSTVYYQDLMVIYDKDVKTTNATALFRTTNENGYIHQLTDHENLNINRTLAPFDPSDRSYYWNSNKLVNVEFILTKNSGYQFQNTVYLSDTSDVDFPSVFPTSINKSSGITVDWDGRVLDSNEKLLLIVEDLTHLPVYKNLVGNQWTFNSTDLLNLTPGTVKIKLERFRILPLQNPDSNSSGRRQIIVRTSRNISLI